MIEGIILFFGVIIIFLMVGVLIGIWLFLGIVLILIYYGL